MPRHLLTIFVLAAGLVSAQAAAPAKPNPARTCATDAADARLERHLFTLINATRAAHHAPPLRWSSAAANAARCHSQEMAAARQLSHTSHAGLNPGQRLRLVDIAWSRVAENVAEAPSIETAQQMMMDEPPDQPNHRANILDPKLRCVGVGIARAGGQLYITEDFYTPLND